MLSRGKGTRCDFTSDSADQISRTLCDFVCVCCYSCRQCASAASLSSALSDPADQDTYPVRLLPLPPLTTSQSEHSSSPGTFRAATLPAGGNPLRNNRLRSRGRSSLAYGHHQLKRSRSSSGRGRKANVVFSISISSPASRSIGMMGLSDTSSCSIRYSTKRSTQSTMYCPAKL